MRHKGKPWEEAATVLQQTLRYQRLSVRELARQSGVHVATTAGIINGRVPSLVNGLRLARALKVSVEDLWGDRAR